MISLLEIGRALLSMFLIAMYESRGRENRIGHSGMVVRD